MATHSSSTDEEQQQKQQPLEEEQQAQLLEEPQILDLPSVEDRTLFLACLTCTVASAYDFDLTVEGTTTSTTTTTTNNNNNKETNEPTPILTHKTSETLYLDEEEEEGEDDNNHDESTSEVIVDELERENLLLEHNIQRAIKIQEKMALAEQRHFVRRYKVAKSFVLKSAEHLLITDSQEAMDMITKELLPMLDSLLEDPDSSTLGTTADSNLASSSNDTTGTNKLIQKAMKTSSSGDSLNSLEQYVWLEHKNDNLQKYLQKLSSSQSSQSAAYQCLSWLLFQHLINADDGTGGYDARIRFWLKSLAVTLWMKEFAEQQDTTTNTTITTTTKTRLIQATKKFESLETCCAERLLSLATANEQQGGNKKNNSSSNNSEEGTTTARRKSSSLGSNIWKGVQIGSVGVGAGILLAVTGGLAAPGIAYGLAVMGMGAVGSAFLSLASSAAVVSLFGVAGGSLAAYKMNRRVSGLTEFTIQQELIDNNKASGRKQSPHSPQLYRTLAISGWLQDKSDFQRPWGVTPNNPPIRNPVEILQRFYYIYNPPLVEDAPAIWKLHGKQNPDRFWRKLQNKYGCNPKDNIYNIHNNSAAAAKKVGGGLTTQEIQILDHIIVAIGKVKGGENNNDDNNNNTTTTTNTTSGCSKDGAPPVVVDDNNEKKKKKEKKKSKRFSTGGVGGASSLLKGWGSSKKDKSDDTTSSSETESGLLRGWGSAKATTTTTSSNQDTIANITSSKDGNNTNLRSDFETINNKKDGEQQQQNVFDQFAVDIVSGGDDHRDHSFELPTHLNTVWNYSQLYGGELYTVKWESNLLDELSDSMKKQVLELTSSATQQVLKVTVASTLIFAAAVPLTIVGALNAIDGTWTLVMDRADEAGKELARSLLVDKGGHRPITLMGYSFGARIIYVALKELAQYQQKWEEHLIELRKSNTNSSRSKQQQKLGGTSSSSNTTTMTNNNPTSCCRVGDLEFDREPASIVEDVIMMGMPKYLSLNGWKACREVVAGRLVNVYSRKDKVLSYMFKYKNLLGSYQPVVGTCTVAVPGVENIDVTDMISSHEDYSTLTGKILQRVRLGQPVRSSSHALDEIALLEEAKNIVAKEEEEKQQQQQQQKEKQQQQEVK